ncbi:single-strand selective monofunctional uracil DNA glycosylase-like isoform X1 [Coccinella septempunctata]|uniref:single-strand selective monofunctional uracil DNA glycosylase-like isoform X1 n=1 Tax=Coccinella septempunctata TaxID=41139 RepID=UPI001D092912|nr:single-strand selective monofunctional uracil DNA glycosylase-like isoform X1 [Coccinella septempunctata]
MLRKKLKLSSVNEQSENKSSSHQGTSVELESNHSIYFPVPPPADASVSNKMLEVHRNLNRLLENLNFVKDPICFVYNPTIYASEPLEKYLKLYCRKEKKVLFVGMNPGPWGMCQTGIPFGEISMVKNWLLINGHVGQPNQVCKYRIVEGFNCTQKEVSGDRFWNLMKELCTTPQRFFNNCFLYNYCPLAFMKEDGGNITPAEMQPQLKNSLEVVCDETLKEVILILKPEIVVGIGRYSEKRVSNVVKLLKQDIKVLYMPHPSPRAIYKNGWSYEANKFITKNNLMKYFQ